jgi:hypothetical protein
VKHASTWNPAFRFLWLSLLCVLIGRPAGVRADGGTIRASERVGGYQVTVFTSPAPLRAGPVDVSVFVQDADTGEPAEGVEAAVRAAPRGRPDEAVGSPATTQAATNKLFRSALLELPEAGWWDFEAAVTGVRGQAKVHFEAEAADRPPGWLALAPWVALPAAATLLFAIHQILIRRNVRKV